MDSTLENFHWPQKVAAAAGAHAENRKQVWGYPIADDHWLKIGGGRFGPDEPFFIIELHRLQRDPHIKKRPD
jgi:hypothetical protein